MKTIFSAVLILAAAILYMTNCQQSTAAPTSDVATAQASAADRVKRGEYLVNTMGCDDCHTPKAMTPQGPMPDMTRRFMGHPSTEPFSFDDKKKMIREQQVAVFSAGMTAIAGPWGVSYTANLTPDDTGIGTWTEAQFMKAIREGKLKGLDGSQADPAAHALACVPQPDRRRPEGHFRVPENDETDPKRGAAAANVLREAPLIPASHRLP